MSTSSIVALDDMVKWRTEAIAASEKVGFVPTMGALHEGHMSLIAKAQEVTERVVVSIFVNPAQFGLGEDFSEYPRTLKADLKKLSRAKVDCAFLPNTASIYPDDFQTHVINETLSSILCGQSRPTHFSGVLTVVLKLLNTVRPDVVVFGKKDYQQLFLIKQMLKDLNLGCQVLAGEILREDDGLAMSSRNRHLTPDARSEAPVIYKGLNAVKVAFQNGERQPQALFQEFEKVVISSEQVEWDYFEIRAQDTLATFDESIDLSAVALTAAKIGGVRLIDNIDLEIEN
jgi:pantoate--beta-alanine ligase